MGVAVTTTTRSVAVGPGVAVITVGCCVAQALSSTCVATIAPISLFALFADVVCMN
jgi:hypothetical protein